VTIRLRPSVRHIETVQLAHGLRGEDAEHYPIYANLMRTSVLKTLKPKKKYLLANVMRILTKMSFYYEFNFTKKKKFFDKLY
jgi:hypothetical protein